MSDDERGSIVSRIAQLEVSITSLSGKIRRKYVVANWLLSIILTVCLSFVYYVYTIDKKVLSLELKENSTEEWKDDICIEFDMTKRVSRNCSSEVTLLTNKLENTNKEVDKKANKVVVEKMSKQINKIYEFLIEK
jgi:hypothetical protein